MQSKYVQLRDALFNKKLGQKQPTGLHAAQETLVTKEIPLKKSIADVKAKLTKAVNQIEAATNKTDQAKFVLLLLATHKVFLEVERLVSIHNSNSNKMDKDDRHTLSGLHHDLRVILNHKEKNQTTGTPAVSDDEILFAHLYHMCADAFSEKLIRSLARDIAAGNTTFEKGSKQLANLAYNEYLKPDQPNDRKQTLMNIGFAHHLKLTTATQISNAISGLKGQDYTVSLEDRFQYKAMAAKDESFTKYRDSLKPLSNITWTENRLHHSHKMRTILDVLVKEANQFYLSTVESSKKQACLTLLTDLGQFVEKIGQIRSVQDFKHDLTNPSAKKPNHNVPRLTAEVNQLATDMQQKIQTLSKSTKSLNWTRILLCALLTLGIGLIAVKVSLNKGSMFFRKEHPVVIKTREVIAQGKADITKPAPAPHSAEAQQTVQLAF